MTVQIPPLLTLLTITTYHWIYHGRAGTSISLKRPLGFSTVSQTITIVRLVDQELKNGPHHSALKDSVLARVSKSEFWHEDPNQEILILKSLD